MNIITILEEKERKGEKKWGEKGTKKGREGGKFQN